ncbi:MAG: hypothetical protein ACRD52_00785 [Candidatus Acidiferrales bacterium]
MSLLTTITSKLTGSLLTGWQSWAIRGLAVLLVTGAVFGYGYVKGVESQSPKIAQLTADLTTARSNTAILQSSIATQNQAVEALRADGLKRAQEAARAMQAAQAGVASAQAEAKRLRKAAGTVGAGSCPAGAALDIVRSGLR